MKANEAPEKIYLQDSMPTDTIGDLWPEWFDAKVSDYSIEYTRTDAFVEKAVNWLQDNLVKETEVIASGCVSVRFNNVIEKFKQAMEG